MQAIDKGNEWEILESYISRFENAITIEDYDEIINVLVESVEGFKPRTQSVQQ